MRHPHIDTRFDTHVGIPNPQKWNPMDILPVVKRWLGGEAEFSPQVGIESHPHTTEVEEEKDDVQISDMDSENYGEGDFANPPTQNNFESPVDPTDFATSSDAETGIMTDPECLEENWGNFYQNCPRWKNLWIGTQNRLVPWPKGVKTHEGKMYLNERLCIPYALQGLYIRQNHAHLGHPGAEKLWKVLETRVAWAIDREAKTWTEVVMSQCDTCQACQRPPNSKRPLVHPPYHPESCQALQWTYFSCRPQNSTGKNTIAS